MKKIHILRAAALLALLAGAPAAGAQTLPLIPYQGRVQTGTPPADFTGTGQFKFALVAGTANVSVQATANAVRTGNVLTSVTVTNQGNGYISAPAVTITGGGGTGAVATAVVTGGKVTSIAVNQGGGGYTSNPSISIAAPPARQEYLWVNNGAVTADPVNAVSVPVSGGLYSVMLGDTTTAGGNMAALPAAAFARPDVRLRVWFNGTQLGQDQRLAPSGYISSVIGAPSLEVTNGTTGLQILPGKLFGAANPDATTLEMAGVGTLGVWDNFSVYNNIRFPGEFGHNIGVEKQTTNEVGSALVVQAGEAGSGGFAKNGGDLWLVGGDAFGEFEGVRGGNVYLRTGAGTAPTKNGNIVLLPGNGGVGIGTSDPKCPLDVAGKACAYILQARSNAAFTAHDQGATLEWNRWGVGETDFVNQKGLGVGGWSWVESDGAGNYTERMKIDGSGKAAIGGQPYDSATLTVYSGGVRSRYGTVGVFNTGYANYGYADDGRFDGTISIYAQGQIAAATFVAYSDERIKNIVGRSESAADLRTLRGIEITDYLYKDVIGKGRHPQKKVIAQQVEKVFPQAVSRSTNVVPDIYKLAPVKDGWVSLATDLKAGDRVKLITNDLEETLEVLEVRKGGFRTAFKTTAEKVFVFGREVKDFRSVDYEAIAMLNVSATQELARKLEAKDAEVLALKTENASLKAELAANAAGDKARDAKLAELAALIAKKPATVATVVAPR